MRRERIGVGLLVLLAAMANTATAQGDTTQRPDIVVFLADDLGWADVSVNGGTEIPTPNVDRLAAAGVTFTRAYVASPSCAPSRAAMLTGLDPLRNGAMLNHARPRADVRRWPAYFRDLGYETVAIGKVAHYQQVTEYGFDHVSHFKYHEDECIAEAVRWLEARRSDKPLCLMVGTNWPHVPWPAQGAVAPEAVRLPARGVDTPETRQARARYLAAVANMDRDLGMVYDAARAALGNDTLFVFTGDHGSQFPFGKWNLYEVGVRTPMIVSWPGHVPPGTRSDALVSWIDLLPTLLEAAGGTAPQGISGRSFLDVARGKATAHRDAIFLTHSGDGAMNRYPLRGVRNGRWKYIRNLDPAAEHHTHVDMAQAGDGRSYWDSWVKKAQTDPQAAAVVAQYHRRPAEELYDLSADPNELTNLAADAAHAEVLTRLRAQLDAWMADQGDTGMPTEQAHWKAREAEQAKTKAATKKAQTKAAAKAKAKAAPR
jgi:N-sulfoglucosamine sulfohydrolase